MVRFAASRMHDPFKQQDLRLISSPYDPGEACSLRELQPSASSASEMGIAMVIDTNSSCRGKSAFLLSKEVTAVGRYYRVIRPEWALSKEEAAELSAAGNRDFHRL